jgi:hypothetical protein
MRDHRLGQTMLTSNHPDARSLPLEDIVSLLTCQQTFPLHAISADALTAENALRVAPMLAAVRVLLTFILCPSIQKPPDKTFSRGRSEMQTSSSAIGLGRFSSRLPCSGMTQQRSWCRLASRVDVGSLTAVASIWRPASLNLNPSVRSTMETVATATLRS